MSPCLSAELQTAITLLLCTAHEAVQVDMLYG